MGVLKNDVGRPSNKTIMIRNILKAILVIIVAGGLFVGGYLLNNKKVFIIRGQTFPIQMRIR